MSLSANVTIHKKRRVGKKMQDIMWTIFDNIQRDFGIQASELKTRYLQDYDEAQEIETRQCRGFRKNFKPCNFKAKAGCNGFCERHKNSDEKVLQAIRQMHSQVENESKDENDSVLNGDLQQFSLTSPARSESSVD